ncbi:MAG: alpha-E domain-containing protein, partial [Paraburkholderia graminis]
MLSRTADHLFWMARYMERAENTARMLDINLKALLLPQTPEQEARAQRSVLRISELEAAFAERHDEPTREHVLDFMVADATNPSSIHSCLHAARENARAVRGT